MTNTAARLVAGLACAVLIGYEAALIAYIAAVICGIFFDPRPEEGNPT
jgi:hypothetical protein